MNVFEQGLTSTVFRPCRNSTIRLVENTLTMMIMCLIVIMSIQYVHVDGKAQYLGADTAHSSAESPKPVYKFVRGTHRVDRVSPDRDG